RDRTRRQHSGQARAVRQPGIQERLLGSNLIAERPGNVANGDLQGSLAHAETQRLPKTPDFSMKTWSEPLTKMSEISGSQERPDWTQERNNHDADVQRRESSYVLGFDLAGDFSTPKHAFLVNSHAIGLGVGKEPIRGAAVPGTNVPTMNNLI